MGILKDTLILIARHRHVADKTCVSCTCVCMFQMQFQCALANFSLVSSNWKIQGDWKPIKSYLLTIVINNCLIYIFDELKRAELEFIIVSESGQPTFCHRSIWPRKISFVTCLFAVNDFWATGSQKLSPKPTTPDEKDLYLEDENILARFLLKIIKSNAKFTFYTKKYHLTDKTVLSEPICMKWIFKI